MSNEPKNQKKVRKTILLVLGILTLLSTICYYAILKLNPTSIYVGALMMSPALSAFITLKLLKRPISSLPLGLKRLKKFAPILFDSGSLYYDCLCIDLGFRFWKCAQSGNYHRVVARIRHGRFQ